MEVGFGSQLCIDQYGGEFHCRQRTLVTSQPIRKFFGSAVQHMMSLILLILIDFERVFDHFLI